MRVGQPHYRKTVEWTFMKLLWFENWIGLDLFNDDTYPSGYISRPSHVGFSPICLSSTKRSGGVVRLRIVSVVNSFKSRVVLDIWPFILDVVYIKLKKLLQFRDCASEGLYRMSDRSYQVEESHFLQEFYNASLRNCLKEPFDIYIELSLRAVNTAIATLSKVSSYCWFNTQNKLLDNDMLVQEVCISGALGMELRLSCTNSSIWRIYLRDFYRPLE